MGDVGAGLADVAAHLAHDADVIIAVEQVELVFAAGATSAGAVRGLVRLKGGAAQHDNQTLRVLVAARDGLVLLGDKLGQVGRGERLRPWWKRHVSRLNAQQVECRTTRWGAGRQWKKHGARAAGQRRRARVTVGD